MTMRTAAGRRRAPLLALLYVIYFSISSYALNTTLPFGDINVVVLTDVHSWVAGHAYHESETLNADYGDVLSFYQRLQIYCNSTDKDLYLVDNGDFVHGTGLSTNPPFNLTPILRKLPFDVINIGNHELEENETVAYMMEEYIQQWPNHVYLSSNVVNHNTRQPIAGRRYKILHGRHSRVLVFGFLYEMQDASPLVRVEQIQHIATTNWFVTALRNNRFDAVLVMAHMDVQDELVEILRAAIRGECGSTMPIQFITGHTHYRGYVQLDSASTSFEAGRYLDTVGFVSFPNKHTVRNSNDSVSLFQHVFLDANKATLEEALPDGGALSTAEGRQLSNLIRETQVSMGLLRVLGCSPKRYYENKTLAEKDSLWGLYFGDVVVKTLLEKSSNAAVFMQSVAWVFRYDLCEGNVTVNDIASVMAKDDFVLKVASGVRGHDIKRIVEDGDSSLYYNGTLPSFWSTDIGADEDLFDVYTVGSNLAFVTDRLTLHGANVIANVTTNSSNVTVRGLWTDYVTNYWKCQPHHGGHHPRGPSGSPSSSPSVPDFVSRGRSRSWLVPLIVVIVVVALVLATMSYCCRRPSHGGRFVAPQYEVDSMLVV